jgi:hypothetical protein
MSSRDEKIKGMANELAVILSREIHSATNTCINCYHFAEGTETCKLANQRPPARVIAFGCKAFEEAIPF